MKAESIVKHKKYETGIAAGKLEDWKEIESRRMSISAIVKYTGLTAEQIAER